MNVIDHKEQAQSRVYAEYRDKPKTMAWIGINGEIGNEIEAVYQAIALSYDIDNADTDELNILGRIVVINRSFESEVIFISPNLGGFQLGDGSQLTPTSGVTDTDLNNDIYRLLIKAKIAKNNNDATLDGIINALSFVVETNNITINDPENMTFSIEFDTLTQLEKVVLLNFPVVPEPQGVRFTGFIDNSAITQLGRNQLGSSQLAFRFGA